jgi:long-chain acyl-CoA synthetase
MVSEDCRLTWKAAAERTARLAGALTFHDLARGSRIGILGLNSALYLEALHGIWWAGAVAVPMNWRFALAEHVFTIDDAGLEAVFVDPSFLDLAWQIAEARPQVRLILMDHSAPMGLLAQEPLIAGSGGIEPAVRSSLELAGIFYTGGTTGRPKGVMHSAHSLWAGAACLGLEIQPPDSPCYLHAAPMFHLGDMSLSLLTTECAGTHVFLRQFSPGGFIELVEAHRIQLTTLVPTMIAMVLDSPGFRREAMQSLHTLMFGGSPIADAQMARLRECLPAVRLNQIFGQTETVGNGTILKNEDRLRSAGRALIGNTVGVFDDAGVPLSAMQTGEIWVRGPSAMMGYLNNTVLTAAALADGWVHTGDAGYLDEEGYLYVCDRLKDMIISGGENVYSAEVENAIASHPLVEQVAVIGVPDEHWGERVHAVIVPRPGAEIALPVLQEHCRPLIAGYKIPRSMSLRTDPLPTSAVGKVAKTELRQPYWADNQSNVN